MDELREADDADLVARCRSGEEQAWRVLVDRYQRLIYTVARRGGLDDHGCADVFQGVFTELFESLDKIARPEQLRAWLVTLARRQTLRHFRHHGRTVAAEDVGEVLDELADPSPWPPELLEDLQQMHLLETAMARLDPRCRRLLQQLFEDDHERLPYDIIAQELGMALGSIGPTRARCLGKLRQLFESS